MAKQRLIDAIRFSRIIKEYRNEFPQRTARQKVCNDILAMLGDETQTPTADVVEWIPVSERLPNPWESVLVCMPEEAPHPLVHEGFINEEGEWYANHFMRDADEVTHWLPIPEPPEEFRIKLCEKVDNNG